MEPPTSAVDPASTETTADLPALGEAVVEGRRQAGQAERDPTASATVILADRFEGEAKNVAELVATAPGVAVNDYGGLGQLATISIRGATADGVLVLLDGLPLNTAAGGGVDLASIPRQWIERIEVVRGAEGACYGAGALGGVVNIVTRSRLRTAAAEAAAGSFETFSGAAEASAGVSDAWILGAAAGETSSGRFPYMFDSTPALTGDALQERVRENNSIRRGGLLLKGSAASADGKRMDALVQISGGRRELPGGMYHLTPEAWERDSRALASFRLGAPIADERLTLAARATARADLLDVQDVGTARQRGGAAILDVQARLVHWGGTLSAFVSGGAEALRADGLEETRRRSMLSASISDDVLVSRVRLGPAVRIDSIGPFHDWSAKLGGAVPVGLGVSLRTSAGRTFRAPSFSELYLVQGMVQPNANLRPEKATSGDAGITLEGARGFLSFGGQATLYDDIIFYQSVGLGLKPFNAGRTLASGLEVEGATSPFSRAGVAVEGSYTYLVTEILRGSAAVLGNDLPHKPRHRLFGRASLAPRNGAAGGHVEAHFVGRQFQDDANARPPIPASLVFNAGIWARLLRRPEVRIQLEVKNVMDDRTLLDPLANPLPGRIALLTIRSEIR